MGGDLVDIFELKNKQAISVPAENLIRNAGFSSGLQYWTVYNNYARLSIVENYIRATFNNNRVYFGQTISNNQLKNSRLFFSCYVRGSKNGRLYIKNNSGTSFGNGELNVKTFNISTEFEKISFFINTGESGSNIVFDGDGFKQVDDYVEIYQPLYLNITSFLGAGNEPTSEQLDDLLKQFPDNWFDGTRNLFNAKYFMNMYFKKITELENAITALGGGS